MLKTAFVSIIFSLISCLAVVCQAAEPVFHLTFQDGLLPQTGGDGELPWGAEKPPDFYDDGLIGPAFLIGENHNNVYAGVPAPDNTADNGTAIFWSRGLEGWDIWSFGADPCIKQPPLPRLAEA